MSTHYDNMKDQIGIREIFESTDSDEETEKIFNKLRPQSPYKFKDLIKGNINPNKFSRMVGKSSHKVDKD